MYSWLQLKTARYSIEIVAVHTFSLHRVPCSTVFVWFRVPKVPLQQMIYNGVCVCACVCVETRVKKYKN